MPDERTIQIVLPPPIGGMDFSLPENLLNHTKTQDMSNALIIDGEIQWRPGYSQLAASYPNFSNRVKEGMEFGDASGNLHTVFFDTAEMVEYTAPSTWTDRSGGNDFTGDNSNAIFAAVAGGLTTEYLYITNGKDNIKRWSGTGNWADLTTTGFATLKAKCMAGFKTHLVLGDTTENSNSYPYRLRWSNVADPTTWNGITSGYVDLVEDATNSKIMCLHPFGSNLIAYKFGSVYQLTYQGDPNYFVPRMMISDRGAISRKGVAPFGDAHLVVSNDNIHVFDGFSFIDPPPGSKIKSDFFGELNWDHREKIFAKAFPGRFEVWIMYPANSDTVPKTGYCWNYKDNTWTKHSFSFGINSLMNFNEAFSTIQPIAGVGTGNVMKFLDGTTDNGIEISSYWRTKLHNYQEFQQKGYNPAVHQKTVHKLEMDAAGSNPSVQFGYVNSLKGTITYETAQVMTDGDTNIMKSDHRATGRYLTLKCSKNSGDTGFSVAQFNVFIEPRGAGR